MVLGKRAPGGAAGARRRNASAGAYLPGGERRPDRPDDGGRILRQARDDPEAALTLLRATVGAWDDGRPAGLAAGRREVICTLAEIARVPEHFEGAWLSDLAQRAAGSAGEPPAPWPAGPPGEWADLLAAGRPPGEAWLSYLAQLAAGSAGEPPAPWPAGLPGEWADLLAAGRPDLLAAGRPDWLARQAEAAPWTAPTPGRDGYAARVASAVVLPAWSPSHADTALAYLPLNGIRGPVTPSGSVDFAPDPPMGTHANISLFFGAGMSAAYGMPTSSQFRDRMLRKYPRRRAWRRLLEDPELRDIEDVWAALDSLDGFAAAPDREYWIRRLKRAGIKLRELSGLRDALESELFDACRWRPGNDFLLDAVLGPVLSLASGTNGRVRVFTTNYDRSVEEYCSDPKRGFQCYDGFEHDPQTGRSLWSGFAGRPAPLGRGARASLPPQTVLDLLKIHGSLGHKVSWRGPERITYEAKSADPAYRDAIVYPSSLPKSAYKGVHGDMFKGFAEGLSASDACVAVGYSFRDPLIAVQFARFVEGGRTLVVIGPEATASVDNVLRLMAGRGGSAKWVRAGVNRLVRTAGRGTVHAIQEEIRPETVLDTVAVARAALAMRAVPAAPPARKRTRKRGGVHGGEAPGRRGRPARAGRR